MQASGSQQLSLLAFRPNPGPAGSVRGFAGVAQLVEHLFCKQVVSGSIPLASSSLQFATSLQKTNTSEGCPSGQREQAVNLPAHAYVGSNPTPSTTARPASGPRLRHGLIGLGSSAPLRSNESSGAICRRGSAPPQAVLGSPRRHGRLLGPRPQNSRRISGSFSAGVAQLVESQFSKLMVEGSSPFSRSDFSCVSRLSHRDATPRTPKQTRCASLVAGEVEPRTGAERTFVREHRTGGETQRPAKMARRANSLANVSAHLAQLVEHVLGKDEVISSNLMVGSNRVQP